MLASHIDEDQSLSSFRGKLEAVCRSFASEGPVTCLRRLTGGANMETWSFDIMGVELILRRMPDNMLDADRGSSISIELESEIVSALHGYDICVPQVLATLSEKDQLGRGYIMTRIEGETLPKRIQTDPIYKVARQRFVADAAVQLARIHSTPLLGALEKLRREGAAAAIQSIRHSYERYGGGSIMFEAAFAWLEERCPEVTEFSLVHGDFRIGNLMINQDGINGVLDWEQSHLGDPVRDLAYMCVPSWRFGGYAKPAAGLEDIETFLGAYEAEANVSVCRQRFAFWLVLNTLWWGVICMEMVFRWRTGADRTLEKVAIGNRVSEVELDLLLLLEEENAPRTLAIKSSDPIQPSVDGKTAPWELATAVSEWISSSILPTAEGSEKFDALVARNCLGMLQRSSQFGSSLSELHRDGRWELDLTQEELLDMAQDGSLNLRSADILRHLRRSVLEQISIDQPRYPGVQYAKDKWSLATTERGYDE